jgi:hypothetical protein
LSTGTYNYIISLQQTRAVSNQQAVGHWSTPDTLTIPGVPSPANITVALDDVKRDFEVRVSFDVLLNWEVPEQFVEKFPIRNRRQTSSGSTASDVPTGYEVLIATEADVGTDYAATPTGAGTFNRTFNVSTVCVHMLATSIFCG